MIPIAAAYRQVDRMGIPAVNVALIPFADKDAYNASNPAEDAKKSNKFAAEIVVSRRPDTEGSLPEV